MPPPGIAASMFFSGICVMTASMVSNRDATDAACGSAERTTFVHHHARLHEVLELLGLRLWCRVGSRRKLSRYPSVAVSSER